MVRRKKMSIPDFPLFQGAKKKKKKKKSTASSPFSRYSSWVLAPAKPKKKTKAKSTAKTKSTTKKSKTTTKKSNTILVKKLQPKKLIFS